MIISNIEFVRAIKNMSAFTKNYKTNNPVESSLKLDIKENLLLLTGFRKGVFHQESILGTKEISPFSFCIDSADIKKVLSIVKKDKEVAITSEGIHFKESGITINSNGVLPDDFPLVPDISGTYVKLKNVNQFKAVFSKMTVVEYITFFDKAAFYTDNIIAVKIENYCLDKEFSIHGKYTPYIKLQGDTEFRVLNEGSVCFKATDSIIIVPISKPCYGEEILSVFNNSDYKNISVNKAELMDILNVLKKLDITKTFLYFRNNEIIIEAEGFRKSIPAEHKEKDIDFIFDPSILEKAMSLADTEKALIHYKDHIIDADGDVTPNGGIFINDNIICMPMTFPGV